jgi:hypothetical protein
MDGLAGNQGRKDPARADPYRVDDKAAAGLAPHIIAARRSRLPFAFHDNEEIGPRMLARIAKHTGLRPDDI